MTDLVGHLGGVHRWVIQTVGAKSFTGPPPSPDEGTDVLSWFNEGADTLVSTLSALDPHEECWNFTRGEQTMAFWIRRQSHETSVHRWDAEHALGSPTPLEADLAVDGIDEFLELLAPRTKPRGTGESIHLHATDADGEWLVRLTPEALEVERGHAKGDAAVKGTASDLLLWAWGRVPTDSPSLEIHGDPAVAARWQELVNP